jgi:hypothetical protein
MAVDPKQTLKELEESLNFIKEGGQDIVNTFNINLVNSLQRSIIETDKLVDGFKKGNNITRDINKSFNDVTRTQISLSNKSINLEKQLQKALRENKVIRQDEIINELTSIKLQQKLNEDILIQLNTLRNINEERKKSNNLSNLLKSSSEKILGTSLSTITSMFTLSGIFALIIESALQFNKASVASGKLLGYGAEKADEIQSNFINIARSTGDVNITSRSLNEAFNQLAESTGYVAEYSEDALKTQIMLTKQFGLTGEEAAGIYKLSVLTGKSSAQVNDEMVGAFVATRNQLKVGIPLKTAIAAAAKVSGQLSANLQNNPSLITKAIVQAAALGTTLEQTANQGERLLDFSSSIENELKAELLTGRQLNLERARAAALAGDQVTLSQELNKNVGSLADYQSMNVLQQKALAEAVGLTADQLSDQLKKQKLAQETGKSLAQITKEEALEAQKRQGIQDKFNASVLKLQDFFGNLVSGPVGKFLEILTAALPLIEGIAVGMGVWWTLSKGIALYNTISSGALLKQLATLPALLGFKTTEAAISTEIAVASISAASAITLGVGIVAIIAGIAAAVGAMKSMEDGIIGPGGETVVSGPKGSIQLDKNDSIIAGTDLFSKGTANGGQTISQAIDLTPMITAINEVKESIDRLYSKNTTISMDGKAVGTTLTQGSYKFA